jgi:hypothetical protein
LVVLQVKVDEAIAAYRAGKGAGKANGNGAAVSKPGRPKSQKIS